MNKINVVESVILTDYPPEEIANRVDFHNTDCNHLGDPGICLQSDKSHTVYTNTCS